MSRRQRRPRPLRWVPIALLAIGLLAVPAAGVPKERPSVGEGFLLHVSQSVSLRFWAAHPEQAPPEVGSRLEEVSELQGAQTKTVRRSASLGDRFNADVTGLPQNEESITACRSNRRIVLGSTNDFRGLLDPEENFTGWHFSNNGGRSLTNEGLLPSVEGLPSGGDPVTIADDDCHLYAASLAYDPATVPSGANGIAVYRSEPEILASCPGGGSDPACWPVRRLVASGTVAPPSGGPNDFLDKEWLYVGESGGETVVWATYSRFTNDPSAPLGFTSAEIEAVRCNATLSACTDPIPISNDPVDGPDLDVQFSDVTVGEDGRTYVTWSEIIGELPGDPDCPNPDPDGFCPQQIFVHKLRVAEPGSTTFGPERVVYVEDLAIPFGGHLHANDFRVATYPKNEVATVSGEPRVFVTWDACSFVVLGFVCEEPVIKLIYSDDLGSSWSDPIIVSRGGDNYFPTISTDRGRTPQRLALAWFTNRFDRAFHNRQDVELLTVNARSVRPGGLRRVTSRSNESEADPVLGGLFIGDYIETFTDAGRIWVHYNANYRKVQLLGEGVPVNQQDNFLALR
jgi:hypothetical protein